MKARSGSSHKIIAIAVAGGVISAQPRTARAFAEDVCFTAGGVADCFAIPAGCDPELGEDYDSTSCEAQLLTTQNRTDPSRSTVHVDATYYIARAVGLDREQAYWLAAYNEATDLGVYVPRDRNGTAYVDPTDVSPQNFRPDVCESSAPPACCALVTEPIDGVSRVNVSSGGLFFHFHAPFHRHTEAPIAGIDGLSPDVDDATTELTLVHLRRWAFGGVPACTAGLTSRSTSGDYATGGECFTTVDGAGRIGGAITAFSSTAVPIAARTGLQIISAIDGEPLVESDQFDAYIGDRAAIARVAIYLHALQDRISHHRCIDLSHLNGPYVGTGANWNQHLDDPECGQAHHAARHAWETGVAPSALDPSDRTTPAALAATWDELYAWALAHDIAAPDAGARKEAVLVEIGAALAVRGGGARLDALAAAGAALGIEPMPGPESCAASSESGAGAPSNRASNGGCDAGSSQLSWAVFLALVVAARLARRRSASES